MPLDSYLGVFLFAYFVQNLVQNLVRNLVPNTWLAPGCGLYFFRGDHLELPQAGFYRAFLEIKASCLY